MKIDGTLGDACEVLMGQAPPGDSYNSDSDGLPLVAGASDFGDQHPEPSRFTTAPTRKSLRGDIILSVRATIGTKVIGDREYCLGRGVAALRAREGLDRRYLWHWLSYSTPLLLAKGKGATFPQVTRGDIESLPIHLPPLDEQRRIAAILDQAYAMRAIRLRASERAGLAQRELLLDLVGDPARNPLEWPTASIGELCEVKGGKRLPKGDEYSTSPTPYRYIRVMDISEGGVDEARLVFLKPETQAEISRYTVAQGDVIVSIAGSIGLVAAVPASLAGANLTENAAKLVARCSDSYVPAYLAAMLRTPFVQAQMLASVGQVTIGKLALFRIERLRVPLPPLDVQQRVAGRLRQIELLGSAHRAHLSKLDELFASLQYRAFRGEL